MKTLTAVLCTLAAYVLVVVGLMWRNKKTKPRK